MDSLDAQCLVVDLFEGSVDGPDHWRHDRDGSLHYHFAGSARSFSWPANVVADMANDWRARHEPPPPAIAEYVGAHRRAVSVLVSADRTPPDAVLHDLRAREVELIWREQKLVVILELDDDGALDQLTREAPLPAG